MWSANHCRNQESFTGSDILVVEPRRVPAETRYAAAQRSWIERICVMSTASCEAFRLRALPKHQKGLHPGCRWRPQSLRLQLVRSLAQQNRGRQRTVGSYGDIPHAAVVTARSIERATIRSGPILPRDARPTLPPVLEVWHSG
jgi:hypothetical protein